MVKSTYRVKKYFTYVLYFLDLDTIFPPRVQ